MKDKIKLPDPRKARRYFAKKLAFTTGPVELGRWLKEGRKITVVDVRATPDFSKSRIPGAVSLPKDRWDKPARLSKDKLSVVYCYSQVCHLAAAAALRLAEQGFPVMELEGGFSTWQDYGMPVEKARKHPARRSHRPAAKAPAPEPVLETEPAQPAPAA